MRQKIDRAPESGNSKCQSRRHKGRAEAERENVRPAEKKNVGKITRKQQEAKPSGLFVCSNFFATHKRTTRTNMHTQAYVFIYRYIHINICIGAHSTGPKTHALDPEGAGLRGIRTLMMRRTTANEQYSSWQALAER